MKNFLGLTLIFIIIALMVVFLVKYRQKTTENIPAKNSNQNVPSRQAVDEAIAKAKSLYDEKKAELTNLNDGPCLANDLMPDWVADIAHFPRLAIDNQKTNQCPAYREGQAHHFVELDTEGKLIRAM